MLWKVKISWLCQFASVQTNYQTLNIFENASQICIYLYIVHYYLLLTSCIFVNVIKHFKWWSFEEKNHMSFENSICISLLGSMEMWSKRNWFHAFSELYLNFLTWFSGDESKEKFIRNGKKNNYSCLIHNVVTEHYKIHFSSPSKLSQYWIETKIEWEKILFHHFPPKNWIKQQKKLFQIPSLLLFPSNSNMLKIPRFWNLSLTLDDITFI